MKDKSARKTATTLLIYGVTGLILSFIFMYGSHDIGIFSEYYAALIMAILVYTAFILYMVYTNRKRQAA